jgi:hypothetical protein
MTLAIAKRERKYPIHPIHVNQLQTTPATVLFDTWTLLILIVVGLSFSGLRLQLVKFETSFNPIESQLFYASFQVFFPFFHVFFVTIYFLTKKKQVIKFIKSCFCKT